MPMTPRRSSHIRHTFLFAAACLLLTWPPTAARAASPLHDAGAPPRQTSAPEDEERPLRRPSGFKTFGKNFLEFLKCKELNDVKRRELLEYGPQFPKTYNSSQFSFQALVGANWPMAIEYELEQQGTAVVTIEVMGAAPFTQTLKGAGMGQGQAVRFTLPAYPAYKGKVLHPALISFKATRDGSKGRQLAEFRFLGAGAGEDAVVALPKGTSGLEVAALGPLPLGGLRYGSARAPAAPPRACVINLCNAKLEPAAGSYIYSFDVGSKFNRWAAEIRRKYVKNSSEHSTLTTKVKDVIQSIGPKQTKSGVWDGRINRRGKVTPGKYAVLVKAWWSGSSNGGWNAKDASDAISIR